MKKRKLMQFVAAIVFLWNLALVFADGERGQYVESIRALLSVAVVLYWARFDQDPRELLPSSRRTR